MGCQHPATKRRPVGLQNRNLGRTCQPMSFTDRQNVSDLLPHVTDLPSSGVEVKSAEVAVQWRNIYSKFILACIYPPPHPAQQPPPVSQGRSHYQCFTITLRHTTVGKTPLDEWSALLRDLYLTTHNRLSCPRRVSNPQSQQASGRRPMP